MSQRQLRSLAITGSNLTGVDTDDVQTTHKVSFASCARSPTATILVSIGGGRAVVGTPVWSPLMRALSPAGVVACVLPQPARCMLQDMTALPLTPTLEDALVLAVQAHRGQLYPAPGGEPFILHPLRVMLRVETPAACIVAVLHDLIEDTPHTLAEMRRRGYPPAIVAALDLLTHRDADPYDVYIARLAPDPLARRVKLADNLADNLATNRRLPPDSDTRARIARYEQAIAFLRAVAAD